MRGLCRILVTAALPLLCAENIRLHPENPHYFQFRGKPTVLIGSGEHYGAVLNEAFDYKRYLDTLQQDRLNVTRTFTGVYREQPGAFQIAGNTLAPPDSKFMHPWKEGYEARLRDFVAQAGKRGVVVELVLFCPYYEDAMWRISPIFKAIPRTEALTLQHPDLVARQDAMVRKIAEALREFDNVYFEIANEPYFGGVTLEWQRHIARTIHEADPQRMIAQNIANGSKAISNPDELVSVFNFHYARPPEAVGANYALNKAIGCNETGFDGQRDSTYRIQGWDFMMAGGALYNNLDYSFSAGFETGNFRYPSQTPGGGGPALREQLRILRLFMEGLPLPRMKPDAAAAVMPERASVRVLAAAGYAYAAYLHHGKPVKTARPPYLVDDRTQQTNVTLQMPEGRYRAAWVDTKTGEQIKTERFRHRGGERIFASPPYREDIALRVLKG